MISQSFISLPFAMLVSPMVVTSCVSSFLQIKSYKADAHCPASKSSRTFAHVLSGRNCCVVGSMHDRLNTLATGVATYEKAVPILIMCRPCRLIHPVHSSPLVDNRSSNKPIHNTLCNMIHSECMSKLVCTNRTANTDRS